MKNICISFKDLKAFLHCRNIYPYAYQNMTLNDCMKIHLILKETS